MTSCLVKGEFNSAGLKTEWDNTCPLPVQYVQTLENILFHLPQQSIILLKHQIYAHPQNSTYLPVPS